mmetsp:Transcript_14823/g.51655  ORF Transcript_14823/g.51655 Transcript_14823/m.51655 type:complete len:200 (+) Transcript_14823:415-1014(+)
MNAKSPIMQSCSTIAPVLTMTWRPSRARACTTARAPTKVPHPMASGDVRTTAVGSTIVAHRALSFISPNDTRKETFPTAMWHQQLGGSPVFARTSLSSSSAVGSRPSTRTGSPPPEAAAASKMSSRAPTTRHLSLSAQQAATTAAWPPAPRSSTCCSFPFRPKSTPPSSTPPASSLAMLALRHGGNDEDEQIYETPSTR